MKSIGENLKYNRENANKSVYDIENDLGISHQNQYNWEKGIREPSIIHCVKLADYFGITIDELIGHSASMQVKPIESPSDEHILIGIFRLLNAEDKKSVMRIAKSLLGDKQPDSLRGVL